MHCSCYWNVQSSHKHKSSYNLASFFDAQSSPHSTTPCENTTLILWCNRKTWKKRERQKKGPVFMLWFMIESSSGVIMYVITRTAEEATVSSPGKKCGELGHSVLWKWRVMSRDTRKVTNHSWETEKEQNLVW